MIQIANSKLNLSTKISKWSDILSWINCLHKLVSAFGMYIHRYSYQLEYSIFKYILTIWQLKLMKWISSTWLRTESQIWIELIDSEMKCKWKYNPEVPCRHKKVINGGFKEMTNHLVYQLSLLSLWSGAIKLLSDLCDYLSISRIQCSFS